MSGERAGRQRNLDEATVLLKLLRIELAEQHLAEEAERREVSDRRSLAEAREVVPGLLLAFIERRFDDGDVLIGSVDPWSLVAALVRELVDELTDYGERTDEAVDYLRRWAADT